MNLNVSLNLFYSLIEKLSIKKLKKKDYYYGTRIFVYSRLKLLIKDAHKSFNQVERELGYPRNTLKNYKYKKKPSVGRVFEMANYFNVSIEFLLGIEEKDNKNSLAYRLEKLNREKKELEILILEGQKE